MAVTMVGRDRDEPHRASTPLELLFDLCFVVAVSQAASALHHGLGEGDVGHSIIGYVCVFFAIWWAWMNFTWFASAYDTDDVPYRLLTFLQIAGVLVLAAGVNAAFDGDFAVITIGYVIMRIAMTAQWLRAAASDPPHRATALRFAALLFLTQLAWVGRLFLPDSMLGIAFVVLVIAEIATPYFAERRNPTVWHPQHIAERYGLFTIIVLGECILSSFLAIDIAITDTGVSSELFVIAIGGLIIMFGIWWTYFRLAPDEMLRDRPELSFVWGYGHYVLFGSIAALGAGIAVAADASASDDHHSAHLSETGTTLAVAIPVAITMLMLAALRSLAHEGRTSANLVGYSSAVLVLLVGLCGGALGLSAALIAMSLIVTAKVAFDQVLLGRSADGAQLIVSGSVRGNRDAGSWQ